MYTAHAGGCVEVGAKHEDLVLATCAESWSRRWSAYSSRSSLYAAPTGAYALIRNLDRFAQAVVNEQAHCDDAQAEV